MGKGRSAKCRSCHERVRVARSGRLFAHSNCREGWRCAQVLGALGPNMEVRSRLLARGRGRCIGCARELKLNLDGRVRGGGIMLVESSAGGRTKPRWWGKIRPEGRACQGCQAPQESRVLLP